jgi:hypothetical protein
MRKYLGLLVGIAAMAAIPAKAETYLMTNYGVTGGVAVAMNAPINQNVLAGQINLTGPDGALDVWCLDLMDHIIKPYLYQVNTYIPNTPAQNMQTLNALQTRQIASLMFNGIGAGGTFAEAATQLAIWKVEYGALFNPLGLAGALLNDFNFRMINSLAGGSLDCPNCVLRVLTDAPEIVSQTFGYVVPAVPLPGAVWLFGGGLVGLVALTRRRRKIAAVA